MWVLHVVSGDLRRGGVVLLQHAVGVCGLTQVRACGTHCICMCIPRYEKQVHELGEDNAALKKQKVDSDRVAAFCQCEAQNALSEGVARGKAEAAAQAQAEIDEQQRK